jgi:hypothetical protein
VILLEIGLWERVDSFDKGALLNMHPPNPDTVQRRLLKHASQRLGFYAGERYQKAVTRCLSGDLGSTGQIASGELDLQLRFVQEVVDILTECVPTAD